MTPGIDEKCIEIFQRNTMSDSSFRRLVESVSDHAIYLLDLAGVVTSWNEGAFRSKGYLANEIIGRHFSIFYTEEDQRLGNPERALSEASREGRFSAREWRVRKDGSKFWASVAIDVIRGIDGDICGFAKVTRDMTDRKENEEKLYQLAQTDVLTGLPNRTAFRELIDRAFQENADAAILIIDLDALKEINDSSGRLAGDHTLQVVAQRVKNILPPTAALARLGGDEFVIIARLCDEMKLCKMADQICASIAKPFSWEGRELAVEASIGIAISPIHGNTPEKLLKNADLALYRAKAEDCGKYVVFQPFMRAAFDRRRNYEQQLRQAFSRGELELFFSAASGHCITQSDRRRGAFAVATP